MMNLSFGVFILRFKKVDNQFDIKATLMIMLMRMWARLVFISIKRKFKFQLHAWTDINKTSIPCMKCSAKKWVSISLLARVLINHPHTTVNLFMQFNDLFMLIFNINFFSTTES